MLGYIFQKCSAPEESRAEQSAVLFLQMFIFDRNTALGMAQG